MIEKMMRGMRGWAGVVVAVAVAGSVPFGAAGQDAEGFAWQNGTELSFVSTGGNSSSTTLGLKSTFTGTGGDNTLKLEFGGIRGETTFRTVTATGTPAAFTVQETTDSELTAENYFVRGRYDRSLGTIFAFGGAGWDRNTFAGVQNRYAFVAGLGRAWVDSETSRFKTDVGGTYTIQKDVAPAPGADDSFAGVRVSVDAMRQLTETAGFTSVLVVDENLDDTDDLRADWTNALTVSLSERLALKTSLQLLFDNQPALQSVPLFDLGGTPVGTDVLTPSDELDTVLTMTLVITL